MRYVYLRSMTRAQTTLALPVRRATCGRWCAKVAALALACAWSGGLWSLPAYADALEVRPVRLTYSAPIGCPTAERFAAAVRARSPRIALVTEGAALDLEVQIGRQGPRAVGRLVVRAANAAETRRQIAGETCADVAAALAFIAAVTADPGVVLRVPAGGSTEFPAAPAGAAPDASPSPAPPAAGADDSTLTRAPSTSPSQPASKSLPRDAAPAFRASAGVHAELKGGLTSSSLLSIPFFVEVAVERPGSFAVAPALRLRFDHAEGAAAGTDKGGGSFAWTTFGLDACPVRWSWGRARLTPCGRVGAGVLLAAGVDVQPTRDATRAWVTIGPLLRGRLGLAGPLFVELEVGAFLPLVRDRFFLEPNRALFRAPIVAFSAASGVGVTFW